MMENEELDSREKSDVFLKLAVKGATKAAKYVLEKILLSNGIPPQRRGRSYQRLLLGARKAHGASGGHSAAN